MRRLSTQRRGAPRPKQAGTFSSRSGSLRAISQRGAEEAGLGAKNIRTFDKSFEAAEAVLSLVKAGDLVLVKGSRASTWKTSWNASKKGSRRAEVFYWLLVPLKKYFFFFQYLPLHHRPDGDWRA